MTTVPRHELLVGLNVTDDAAYDAYRAAMTPLLEAAGGYFRLDFTIDRALKGLPGLPLNRIFVISFPGEREMQAFFADPEYLAAKQKHFERAVARVEVLATFHHPWE